MKIRTLKKKNSYNCGIKFGYTSEKKNMYNLLRTVVFTMVFHPKSLHFDLDAIHMYTCIHII